MKKEKQVCDRCSEDKPLETLLFHSSKSGRPSRFDVCAECRNELVDARIAQIEATTFTFPLQDNENTERAIFRGAVRDLTMHKVLPSFGDRRFRIGSHTHDLDGDEPMLAVIPDLAESLTIDIRMRRTRQFLPLEDLVDHQIIEISRLGARQGIAAFGDPLDPRLEELNEDSYLTIPNRIQHKYPGFYYRRAGAVRVEEWEGVELFWVQYANSVSAKATKAREYHNLAKRQLARAR